MSKRGFRGVLLLSLLSLAGFFVMIGALDQQANSYQATTLRRVAQTYSEAPETKNNLMSTQGVTIAAVADQPRTTFERVISDGLSGIRGQRVVTTLHNGQENLLVYYFQRGEQWFAIAQPKNHVWQEATPLFWSLIIFYAILIVIGLWLMIRRDAQYRTVLGVMTKNLERIRQKKAPDPVILPPESPFAPVASEVNELAAAQTHLREKVALRQASFDRLIDHLPLGVMLIDTDKSVVLHNHAMSTLIGHKIPGEAHSYLDDVKTYDLARMIEHTFRHQKSHHKEIMLIATQKSVDASVIAVNQGTDRFQALVILYDVTYLRQVEQMQLDFVSNVSHELKTPVTAISGFAETLLNGAKDDPETLDRFLNIIHEESNRLTQLINDILTLSRPERATPTVSEVNLDKLIKAALDNVSQTITTKQLHITRTVETDLTVQADEAKLDQIVRNLINNAVYYNRQQGQVMISAQVHQKTLRLIIRDTGLGIPEAEQHRIFERFYRVDKARSRHNGGTGLGLAIVKEMVDRLDGRIVLTSQVGVGSTFTVVLPLTH